MHLVDGQALQDYAIASGHAVAAYVVFISVLLVWHYFSIVRKQPTKNRDDRVTSSDS